MYALPIWAPKLHLSHTGCKKSKTDRAVGSKIGRKKGRSSKRGGTGAFSVVIASI